MRSHLGGSRVGKRPMRWRKSQFKAINGNDGQMWQAGRRKAGYPDWPDARRRSFIVRHPVWHRFGTRRAVYAMQCPVKELKQKPLLIFMR